ncbi:MAG: hypothetical protein K2W85_01430 [Phycisphaerales bacterium]|nr:hypothetical protein [Phycisphaerales bacterium]
MSLLKSHFSASCSLMVLTFIAGKALAQVTLLPAIDPSGGTFVYGINDAGQVVGDTTPSGSSNRSAALWTGGALSVLPSPAGAPPGGLQGNAAFGINNNGVAVGLTAWPTASSNFAARAVRWENGVATDLGAFPGATVTAARSINAAGEISGTASGGFGDPSTALRWTNSGTRLVLDRLPTHTDSVAWKINSSGRIVGSSGIVDGDFQPVRSAVYWDGTSATELTTPAGYNQGDARGINDAGTIVGSSAFFDDNAFEYTAYRATAWTADAPQLLPLLDGFVASDALSVNANGFIIGAVYTDLFNAPFGIDGVPVLWTSNSVIDLRSVLAPSFPVGSQFTVTDINAANEICGYATGPGGARGFILTVPAPGAAGLMAMAGLLAARRRRTSCCG